VFVGGNASTAEDLLGFIKFITLAELFCGQLCMILPKSLDKYGLRFWHLGTILALIFADTSGCLCYSQ
jgi:hypothetical protein